MADVVSAAFDGSRKSADGDDELVYAVILNVHMFWITRRSAAVLGSIVINGDNSSGASEEAHE